VAGTLDLAPDQARAVIRDHASEVGRPVAEIARTVIDGTLDLTGLAVRPTEA
jgi:hypothetical protein